MIKTMISSNVGSVVEFSPATREARVRFPDVAFFFRLVVFIVSFCTGPRGKVLIYSGVSTTRHWRITKARVIRAKVEPAERIISKHGQKRSHEEPKIEVKKLSRL